MRKNNETRRGGHLGRAPKRVRSPADNRSKFPQPSKLSANRSAWWESDILAFLDERDATRGEADEVRRAATHRAAAASISAPSNLVTP